MAQDDFGIMLDNLTQTLGTLDDTFYVVSAISGLSLIGISLIKLKTCSTQHNANVFPHLLTLLFGTLLFGLKTFIDAASLSLFEQEAALSHELNQIAVDSIFKPYLRFAITVTVLLGIYSAIKGLMRLRQASLGQETCFWQGLTHLLGGIACINIVTLARLIGQTTGGAVQSLISKLFG